MVAGLRPLVVPCSDLLAHARSGPSRNPSTTMSLLRRIVILLALGGLGSFSQACDNKVGQCNALIEVVNEHTEHLAETAGKLQEPDPAAADAFIEAVEAADAELAALQLDDPTVAGFAKDYRGLMSEAKKLVQGVKAAGDDLEQRNELVQSIDLATMEDEIVRKVKAYCPAP